MIATLVAPRSARATSAASVSIPPTLGGKRRVTNTTRVELSDLLTSLPRRWNEHEDNRRTKRRRVRATCGRPRSGPLPSLSLPLRPTVLLADHASARCRVRRGLRSQDPHELGSRLRRPRYVRGCSAPRVVTLPLPERPLRTVRCRGNSF